MFSTMDHFSGPVTIPAPWPLVSTVEADDKSEENQQESVWCMAACILLVLGIITAAALIAASVSTGDTTATLDEFDGDTKEPLQPEPKTTTMAVPTLRISDFTGHKTGFESTSAKRKGTTTQFTTSEMKTMSTVPTTPATSTAITTESPPMYPEAFVCTVSNEFRPQSKLPEDGLCEIIFYDSLYRDRRNQLGGPYDRGFDHFVDLMSTMEETELGVSFDNKHGVFLADSAQSSFQRRIDMLGIKGVQHFGVLNAFGRDSSGRGLEEIVTLLEDIRRRVQANILDERVVLTVLGIAYRNQLHWSSLGILIKHPPSLVIYVSHHTYKDVYPGKCTILPPTVYDVHGNKNFRNRSDMADLGTNVLNAKVVRLSGGISGAISFTMRALLYQPKDTFSGGASHDLFAPCKTFGGFTHLPPYSVCSLYESYKLDKEVDSIYAYGPLLNSTVTLDSKFTMARKACQAMTSVDNRITELGIAVYDIEFDAEPAACLNLNLSRGSFRRVKMLKNLRDFFIEQGYIDYRHLQMCFSVT